MLKRTIRAVLRRCSPLAWAAGWLDPLNIARRTLHAAIRQRAGLANGRMLDMGCGAQPYRDLFGHVDSYVAMDLPIVGRVDVGGDALALPFRDDAFDTVLCNQVLEHVPRPELLMAEVVRAMRPGGVLILTTPQTWGLHHEPHDFFRFTHYGLRHLAGQAGLEEIDAAPTCGMWAALTQRAADTIVHTYAAKWPRFTIPALSLLLAPALLAGYALDKAFGKRGDTLDNVLTARKPGH